MNTLKKNKRRMLVDENRYAVYDNKMVLEVWFSDKQRALDWWEKNKDRETYSEMIDRERAARRELLDALPDDEIDYEELPFN